MALPMPAVLPGMYLLCFMLIHGHRLGGAPAQPHAQPRMLQGVPAAAWNYPQPQMLRGVPSPVWTYPWATIPSEVDLLWHRHNPGHRRFEMYLLWCGLIHCHRCFGVSCSCVDSSTGHSPFDLNSHWSSSPSSTAAQKQQWCPGHLPAQAHCHCCYQNVPRHSRVR